MIAMNKEIVESNTSKRINWDILQEQAISNEILDKVIRFNQSAAFSRPKVINSGFISPITKLWLEKVEYTDILPDMFEDVFQLPFDAIIKEGSAYNYDSGYQLSEKETGNILYKAFGRGIATTSKRYGSAGALYPVMPLLFLFNSTASACTSVAGVYMIDSFSLKMYRIKTWSEEDIENVKMAIGVEDDFISPLAIGYAIDLRRAITKYRTRGYRHALIEVGLMAQSFRESLREVNSEFGDLCWSGFNDNSLTYLSGLNVRLSPITLIQWFGKKVD